MKFVFYVLVLVVLYVSWRRCNPHHAKTNNALQKYNTIWKIKNMLKQNTKIQDKNKKTTTIVEISFADGFVMTIEKKRNRTVLCSRSGVIKTYAVDEFFHRFLTIETTNLPMQFCQCFQMFLHHSSLICNNSDLTWFFYALIAFAWPLESGSELFTGEI